MQQGECISIVHRNMDIASRSAEKEDAIKWGKWLEKGH